MKESRQRALGRRTFGAVAAGEGETGAADGALLLSRPKTGGGNA